MRRCSLRSIVVTTVLACALWIPALPGAPTLRDAHAARAAASPVASFAYVSIWYAHIYIGDTQHIQLQARDHVKHGIWVIVHFSSSLVYAYYESTDANGFWSKEFTVPTDSLGAHSAEATVTFQLWYGNTTAKDFLPFTPLVPPATYESIVSTVSNFSIAVGKGDDPKAKSYLTDGALTQANSTSVLQTLGLPERPTVYLYNIQSYTDLNASVRMTYYVLGVPYHDQFEMVQSGGWKISQITPVQ
jgi:hypothetical protein